jgi:ribosomal protein RSM22 (predicted rRNA methylase)
MDISAAMNFPPADLVVAAYALGELSPPTIAPILARIWDLARDAILIVEPGTPVGFALVRQARRQLVAAGGSVVAPCPHSEECPMIGGDWCHFARRIPRSALQRRLKQANLSYEDEKFSYVAVTRQPDAERIAGRVIRHPQIRSGHIYLDLCTPAGLERRIVTRSQREAFRQARRLEWGSALTPAEESGDTGFNDTEEAP